MFSRFDDLQTLHLCKMPLVESHYGTVPLQSCCRHNHIVESDHLARGFQLGPEARMFIRGLLGVRNNGHDCYNGLKIRATASFVSSFGSLHSMPKFGHGDRGNFECIVRPGRYPILKIEYTLFAGNDDIGIEHQRHLSAGALMLLRAAARSLRQDFASSSDKRVEVKASANSRPRQTFSRPGTSCATGVPLLSSTNVVFW